MHSPFVSVVGRVVILCCCVLCCASWKAPSCAFLCSPEVVHSSGLLLGGDFPPVWVCNPCSVRGKSSATAERCQRPPCREDGTREVLWVCTSQNWSKTGSADGAKCCLCLQVLHTFGNGCCWSSAVWKGSDSLPYVQCPILAKPQLWASFAVLGRLNKPGLWCLKVLGVGFGKLGFMGFGKLAFKCHCYSWSPAFK